jgi:hypothetical protein
MIIQGVSKMLGQILGVSFPYQNNFIFPQTIFEVQPPRSPDLNLLDLYLWGHLKTYSAPIENEKTLHQRIFYACQTISYRLGTFEMMRQSMVRRVHVCTYSGSGHFEDA